MEDNGKIRLKKSAGKKPINNKPNILLDIDQTLIDAVPLVLDEDDDEEFFDFRKYKEKAKRFDFENMDDYYVIFERPHLQKFLDYIFENFNVSI